MTWRCLDTPPPPNAPRVLHFPWRQVSSPVLSSVLNAEARESAENIRYECGCILSAPDAARSTDRRAGIGSRQDIRMDVCSVAGQGRPPLVFPVERHGKKIKTWAELTACWSHASLRCLRLGPLSDLIPRGWLWWRVWFFFFQEERCRSLCMRW